MSQWDWGAASDVANTITAISAVAGVIVAAVLGLKAISIARQDHDRSAQEFLYAQVDVLLQSGLTLSSAASELAAEVGEGELVERGLDREAESFQSRLQLLRELELVDPKNGAANACDQFAHVLVVVAKASHVLLRDGRNVLASTIFDGESDGAGILRDLATQVHAYADMKDLAGYEHPGSDGQGVSRSFDGTPAVAAQLRVKLADAAWEPSVNQSLRLVMPWIRTELGWLYIQAVLDDGTPLMMMDSDWGAYFNEEDGVLVEPPHPHPDAEEWLKKWPSRFWQAEDHGDDPNDPQAQLVSPEELTTGLFNDLRGEFITRISTLVREMRANSSPSARTD